MSITKLTGVIDPTVYEYGKYPLGTEVQADIQAIINKQSEVIDLAEDNATDIGAAEAAATALEARVTDVEAVANANLVALGSATLSISSDVTLTAENCNDYRQAVVLVPLPFAADLTVTLPADMITEIIANSWYQHPITIVNGYIGTGNGEDVLVEIDTGAVWGDGTASTSFVHLRVGEAATFFPVRASSTQTRWVMIYGKTYSDLTI